MPRRAGGFTLVEVMVALAIGSAVVLMVHQTFAGAVTAGQRLDAERRTLAVELRARQRLTQVFASLDVATAGFSGNPTRIDFATAQRGRPAELQLVLDPPRMMLRGPAVTDTLLDVADGRFEYLLSEGANSRWVAQWHSPSSAPVAVRLRLVRDSARTDTLLLVIGPRG